MDMRRWFAGSTQLITQAGCLLVVVFALIHSGCSGLVSSKSQTTDPTPPTVSITSPASGATVSGTITVAATASDNVAVASVQFQVDGSNLGAAVTAAPYSQSLNTTTLANGKHSLTAVAADTSGNKATSAAVSITVNNTSTTPVTVSITSPASGATVSGTISVTATATAAAGVSSVQFLLDGATLGSASTSSPYSVSWATTTASDGSHTLAAKATDKSGNSATSANVTVNVSQSTTPPPPPAGDDVTVTDASGLGQTNRAVSISRPFVQGEIAGFAQASIGGSALQTQCDVKNRWPDGSLKFAVVSFVIPNIPANGSVIVSFSNQTSGNNTGFLAQSDMLNSAYNFDGQIQLTGAASHNISARAILSAAGSCNDPGNDPDSGQFECTYWLKGPIVTAVILEDRKGRSFDVNTDNGAGNPLHPIFEAWFYPQGNLVQLGYTLENTWASTTAANSARDQTYNLTLTAGNTSPVTLFGPTGSQTVITRTAWHRTFCANGTGVGNPNVCGPPMTIAHNWGYLAETKFLPHWDTNLVVDQTWVNSFVTAWNSATTNKGITGNTNGVGFWPGINTPCGGSNSSTTGDGCTSSSQGLDQPGQAYYHGPLTTLAIVCLLTSDPNECGTVMLGNADMGYEIPYFFREADTSAGHGGWFDAPNNTVHTQGRVVSINARTQINLGDTTSNSPVTFPPVGACNQDFAADWINYGGSGQDLGIFSNSVADTSHWGNIAYVAYLYTGQYAYYEEQLMQTANAIGNSGTGTHACALPLTQASLRQGARGYADYTEERTWSWAIKEYAYGAFIAIDGSPEGAYFLDKLRTNLAVTEGSHGIPCDIPGTGIQTPYCGGSAQTTAWSYGNTVRKGAWSGTALGSWTVTIGGTLNQYVPNPPLCQTGSGCTIPASANSNFQNDYSNFTIGLLNDFGFCPQTNGACQIQQFGQNWFINVVKDPNANMFLLSQYVYPTLSGGATCPSGSQCSPQITAFSQLPAFYAPGGWPIKSWGGSTQLCGDEGYGLESLAALSYGYALTSNEGYTGSAAWNVMRPSLLAACTAAGQSLTGAGLGNGSPKWDITPR